MKCVYFIEYDQDQLDILANSYLKAFPRRAVCVYIYAFRILQIYILVPQARMSGVYSLRCETNLPSLLLTGRHLTQPDPVVVFSPWSVCSPVIRAQVVLYSSLCHYQQ